MKIGINFVQALILILAAPLVRGIIARCKALLQRRQGASIFSTSRFPRGLFPLGIPACHGAVLPFARRLRWGQRVWWNGG